MTQEQINKEIEQAAKVYGEESGYNQDRGYSDAFFIDGAHHALSKPEWNMQQMIRFGRWLSLSKYYYYPTPNLWAYETAFEKTEVTEEQVFAAYLEYLKKEQQ